MKIYTKTGDKGKTSLVSGTRVSKSHLRLEVYGTIDELNSVLGFVSAANELSKKIRWSVWAIQNKLFDLGSQFANDVENPEYELPDIDEADILFLEDAMDKYTEELPELKSFILPGGHNLIVQIHLARTICRRAERNAVKLSQEFDINAIHLKYLNRLSDYLFVLARVLAVDLGIEETEWNKNIKYPKL